MPLTLAIRSLNFNKFSKRVRELSHYSLEYFKEWDFIYINIYINKFSFSWFVPIEKFVLRRKRSKESTIQWEVLTLDDPHFLGFKVHWHKLELEEQSSKGFKVIQVKEIGIFMVITPCIMTQWSHVFWTFECYYIYLSQSCSWIMCQLGRDSQSDPR